MRGNCCDSTPRDTGVPTAEIPEKELTRAKDVAYRYLSYRPRSRSEIEQKLRDKEFGKNVIAAVLVDLERMGYVNDREFAGQWASSRIRLRGFGRRRIEQELTAKGISRDIIAETLVLLFDESPEPEIALREAEKKLKNLTRFEPEVQRRRIAGHLERKGFPTDIIYDVLRELRGR